MIRTDYTREELIAICEQAVVPEAKWSDRDSHEAHMQLGRCWALLKAGCPFTVRGAGHMSDDCVTDEETVWLDVFPLGFRSFEYGEDEKERDDYREDERFYLPTPGRLNERSGSDWY